MANVWGADVERLRSMAGSFDDGAERITAVREVLDQLITSMVWRGPDAQDCEAWWFDARVQLDAAASALAASARSVRANADAQEAASAVDGGAAGAAAAVVGGASPEPSPSPGPAPEPPDDVDHGPREDQRRESRRDMGSKGDGTVDPDYGTEGPDPFGGTGLGPGVPGTSVARPDAPWWTPSDLGSDENGPSWNTENAGFTDKAKEWAVHQAANAVSGMWPDASRNLLHYLGNSGDPLDQPVDKMLADMPGFEASVGDRERKLGVDAVAAAKAQGATEPITFPVRTGWAPGNAETKNWYYATGSFDYGLTGQVTVYPPDAPGGEWRYETETVVNTRDRYNWDGGKSTTIGPFHVEDTELQEFHRKGLAQEFNLVGESSVRTGKGEVS